MSIPDLILIHPPSVFDFREHPGFYGPVSDVVPSSSIFEIYPIGFLTISDYLHRHGISVRIVNLAMKMLTARSFDPVKFVKKLRASAFGVDLHWLPHVDGSLSLAEMLKKYHPDKPVILGGLSATYYHSEIMSEYPFIDFIVLGDSTEEPLRMLMEAIKSGTGFDLVPNLVWRDQSGKVITNELSNRPEDLDCINFDYLHLLRMAIKYRDPSGYIPFRYWLSYPVMAVFQCRGCNHNCASCAGSLSSFKRFCMREKPCFRSPELLAEDIRKISEYSGAPVMVLGDLLQAGSEYAERFLDAVKEHRIENEVTIEFFNPPPESFIIKVADCLANFNVEISPESHDPKIRKMFGKHYDNRELEQMVATLLKAGCRRVDIFFMIGLPYQDYDSVMETVKYCEELLQKFGGEGRVLPMIAPLAPFIDPGSSIFEEPQKFGYRLFYRTLREHRQAMLMPSWKYMLNYETAWMKREDIVRATYDAALLLLDIKEKYGVLGKIKAEMIRNHIKRAKVLIEQIDGSSQMDDATKAEIFHLNNLDSLCDKHELDWPIKGLRLNFFKLLRSLL
ncbi:MAG: TIGR04190 family B12-binding domain/radical SAM domain protein [Dissulfurispiraceae bacterium]|jgi:B12-binding domain/radical SAM domain protein